MHTKSLPLRRLARRLERAEDHGPDTRLREYLVSKLQIVFSNLFRTDFLLNVGDEFIAAHGPDVILESLQRPLDIGWNALEAGDDLADFLQSRNPGGEDQNLVTPGCPLAFARAIARSIIRSSLSPSRKASSAS